MAAIFGVWGKVNNQQFKEMNLRLSHRGQFVRHASVADTISFGVRTDVENSCFFKNSDVSVVAIGSIYNLDDMLGLLAGRDILSLDGTFASLIGGLYSVYGTSLFHKIEGDFSFAIWDHNSNKLILCRDYFGLYPIYYVALGNGSIAFASEYKGLLPLCPATPEVDPNMLQYLQFSKKLPVGKTLFNEIRSIPPGVSAIFLKTDKEPELIDKFPSIRVDIADVDEDRHCSDLFEVISKAIERRVADSERIGIALSGGIDSIGIACLCRKMYPDREIHTFSAGYGESDTDLSTANLVSKYIKSVHHEVLTPPSLLESSLENLVWHMEDPFSRSESLQLYMIAREAKKHVPALMSGQGADSLFAGMPKYKLLWYMKKYPWLKLPLTDIYSFTQTSHPPESLLGRILKALYFRGSVPFPPSVVGATVTPHSYSFSRIGSEFVNDVASKGFQYGQCQDIQKFERNLAAFGLEYKSPFYDLSVVSKAFAIPDQLKIFGGTQKYILRQAFRGVVPEKFLQVPKLPQRMNYDMDFSLTLNKIAATYLTKESIENRGFFKYSDVKKLIKTPLKKPYSPEWGMRIWTVILTEIWARVYLDQNGQAPTL
ncbi:MAG: asparagine synthase-related protein [Desulfuromonadales bacterium]|nr:asparagine synthase-related protein [Desulfuromonadales bacterium]